MLTICFHPANKSTVQSYNIVHIHIKKNKHINVHVHVQYVVIPKLSEF